MPKPTVKRPWTLSERLWFIRDEWDAELELMMSVAEEMFSEEDLHAVFDRVDGRCPNGTPKDVCEDAVRAELLQLVRPQ